VEKEPSFKIDEIKAYGEVAIKFSKKMKFPEDLMQRINE